MPDMFQAGTKRCFGSCLHKHLTGFILAQRSQYDGADCAWKQANNTTKPTTNKQKRNIAPTIFLVPRGPFLEESGSLNSFGKVPCGPSQVRAY